VMGTILKRPAPRFSFASCSFLTQATTARNACERIHFSAYIHLWMGTSLRVLFAGTPMMVCNQVVYDGRS
jgi:hypothetical protein